MTRNHMGREKEQRARVEYYVKAFEELDNGGGVHGTGLLLFSLKHGYVIEKCMYAFGFTL